MGEKKPELKLKELGTKLASLPPSSHDSLSALLEQAATYLSKLRQSPSAKTLEGIQPFLNAIVNPDLLKHEDKDVKLLVAACLCEITRITAPDAPYTDDILKDTFELIVGTFKGLGDASGPSFGRRVAILEMIARYRSCVVMLDLECDDLVHEMFTTFLAVASEALPESVISSMHKIMTVLIDESEDVLEDLVLVLLSALGRKKDDVSKASRRLAMKVIKSCAERLEPGVKQFLVSSMSEDSKPVTVQEIDYHDVIYDLFRCAPELLVGIVPYLTGELLSDQLETRLRAVSFTGDLFSSSEPTIAEPFQLVFSEFLTRLTDRAVEIRMSVLDHVKSCLLADPSRSEASQIISALCDRLLDYDENVRKRVVEVICDVASTCPNVIPAETVKVVADRLRDRSPLVKTFTMEKLADIFRVHCTNADPTVDHKQFDWIPGKILRCYYDRDFRSELIESVLHGSLYPSSMSVGEKVKCWVRFFAVFDKVEVKALERMLEQKQRLQLEMQRYLSLRQMYQGGDVQEIHQKSMFCFKIMSRFFFNPEKAEENFQALDQIEDTNLWNVLSSLLNPDTSFNQSHVFRSELQNILGENHCLSEFLGTLSLKCSYLLFNKEYVGEIILEASVQKFAGNTLYIQSCMNMLVILSQYSPSLLVGFDEELVNCLKDSNEIVKEGALNILAKGGGIIREQLAQSSSSVDLLLETLCLEGSRRQAKYAVHALAAIARDDGLKSLSVLYKRLVDMLEEKSHLPAVLQSLGCIAQTAMPVFETRETEIQDFIHCKILMEENQTAAERSQWDDRTDSCLLKIYGLKTLVKSYLPSKDAHLRPDIDKLLATLKSVLLHGDVSEKLKSSLVDRAQMKLAAAKAIVRLAKCWEHKIPLDIFELTLQASQSEFPQARRGLLSKIHHYIKDHLLDARYACSFAFGAGELKESELKEEKQNLMDIIQMQYQLKSRQQSVHSDVNSSIAYPEGILPFLIHALAHHSCPEVDECKDIQAFETISRQLYYFLSTLIHGDDDGKAESGSKKEKENVSLIISVLRNIKRSEDVVDVSKTKKSYALCDLGLFIMKKLTGIEVNLPTALPAVPLPSMLYRLIDILEGQTEVCEGKTWLADENILAPFELLELGTESSKHFDTAEKEDEKITGSDEKELPLKKVMKQLKSKRTKGKNEKRKSLPEETKVKKDLDVLNMVRQINLDTMDVSNKPESRNGHEKLPKKENKSEINYQNGDKSEASDASRSQIPKRRRSTIAHGTAKSLKRTTELGDDDFSADSALFTASSPKASISSSKRPSKSFSRNHAKAFKEPEKFGTSKQKTMMESPKNKRKIVSGLSKMLELPSALHSSSSKLGKCTSRKDNLLEDLIGCRIKVWWPMDKQFYEGTVKSYDLSRSRHVVLYDDGDVEILNLEKEKWEIVNKGHKAAKRLKSFKASAMKKMSPDQKIDKILDNAPGLDSLEKIVKRKRTPKKMPKKKKISPEERSPSEEGKGGSNAEIAETASSADDVIDAGIEERPLEDGNDDDQMLGDESDEKIRSFTKRKQMNELEGSPQFAALTDDEEGHSDADSPPDAQESQGEEEISEPPESVQEERDPKKRKINGSESESQGKSNKLSVTSPSAEEGAEILDDEPLRRWKKRVGGKSDPTRSQLR
ncbi:hypothetical protein MLD38_036722 [Melastoma candidum]|uniref:Uncharacterized protein n=1 Tax=Melastoma candidum TaxID=119954 RepID=A0ACB9LKL7_9MYRT|nr:hypothetical protein MLD38_036722 [Melastoma candidum]